jgi:hypothetical protein
MDYTYDRRTARNEVWLPDLLGAKEPVVKKAWNGIKREAKGGYGSDPKAAAGGVVYFTLSAAGGQPLGKKLWNLLDRNAGLSADAKWESVARQVVSQLHSADRDVTKVRAAGFAVGLLTLSRQRRKADAANDILNRELASEIAATALEDAEPGVKETPQTVFQSFMTPEVVNLAKSVARKLGGDPTQAGDFILDLMEDVNAHSEMSVAARIVPSTGGGIGGVSDVAQELDWGIQSTAAFSVALMKAVGKSGVGTRLQRALIRADPEMYDPMEL